MRTRLAVHLRHAFSVGLVGGFLLGCREALLTLQSNAFVQPGQYVWVYLAVPPLTWIVLGSLLLLPVALAVATRPAAPSRLWVYASALGFAGALSIVVPWLAATTTHLRHVGVQVGLGFELFLWAVALLLAGAAALVLGAAVAAWDTQAARGLRPATRAVLAVAVLSLLPVAQFLARDWKWGIAATEPPVPASDQPNVLLISIDTLRADHLGSYGDRHGLTPRLDQLAAEGVVFERALTSSPWTLPAIASLLTARYPRHHGAGAITNRRDPLGRSALPSGSWTLAAALRARGYRTHAIVTNPYLALRYGLGEGFDSYENVTIESEAFLVFGHTTAVRLLTWLRGDLAVGDRGETVSARARGWLSRSRPDRPFFLWLHYVDPHPPYSRARASRHKSFRSDSLLAPAAGPGDGIDLTLTSPDVARLRSGEIRLSLDQKEAVRALYRAEVASVDQAIGTVLDALDHIGLRDRTLIVCVADHGEEFWEHGGVEHGHTVYEELVHVPLLARWPSRLPAGARVDAVVRITDVAPTIADLLGMPAPPAADGQSLVPLLRGEEHTPRIALSENLLFAEERIGLRTREHKYIRWENGKEEVYHLAADPDEHRDLAALTALSEPLRQLYAEVGTDAATSGQANAPTLDGAAAESLRALGYLH